MVLPSSLHDDLTSWLNARSRWPSGEYAGVVVVADLRPVAFLFEAEHFNEEVEELLSRGRAELTEDSLMMALTEAQASLAREIKATLSVLCGDLQRRGIEAVPYEGLGVLMGDELLSGAILVRTPVALKLALGIQG